MNTIKTTYNFNINKSLQLKKERGIGFEEIIMAIDSGHLKDIINHPNPKKYKHQKIYVIEIENYIYLVPLVKQKENEVFLKTIFPSRKLTKQYLGGNDEKKT